MIGNDFVFFIFQSGIECTFINKPSLDVSFIICYIIMGQVCRW